MPLISLAFLTLVSSLPSSAPFASTTVVGERKTIAPTEWLVLPAVDGGGRRPFRPDRVFGAHLLDRDSTPPVVGTTLVGEEMAGTWAAYDCEKPGRVAPGFRLGWAYTAVEVDEPTIAMARLEGGSRLFVNGAGFAGDVYRYGFGGVPVALEAGVNHIFINGLRGAPKFTLTPIEDQGASEGALVVAKWDALIPHLVSGGESETHLEVPVFNASRRPLLGGRWSAEQAPPASLEALEPVVPGDIVRRAALEPATGFLTATAPLAPFPLRVPVITNRRLRTDAKPKLDVFFSPRWGAAPEPLDPSRPAWNLSIPTKGEGETRRVVFPSAIDGSLQEYGLVARDEDQATEGLDPSLVLSLHGASVPAMNQARAYGRKGDFWIAAALNRRPYGFDWQDWGRLDAYEALEHALALTGIDEERVFLTGHSMGGHGTWHLAANDPDRFVAIAPSAGWSSFDTYGGRPGGSLDRVWRAADGASLTLDLVDNLVSVPTYVLHGTKDDNVPISEAERMLAALDSAGGEPEFHFEEGAGHWWGNRCVDWPGIFELFTSLASQFKAEDWRVQPDSIHFRTTDPAVDSKHYWVEVLQPRSYGQPVEVRGEWDAEARVLTVAAPGAAALRLSAPNRGRPVEWNVGDMTFAGKATQRHLSVVRDERGHWVPGLPHPGEKSPTFSGPFKRAFANGFILVYGTSGDGDEDLELLERARYDLERWSYRAGGEARLLSDEQFMELLAMLPPGSESSNVILYGNRESNSAWSEVLGDARGPAPVDVQPGLVRIGERVYEGDDLLMLFVSPRVDCDAKARALVGAFGSTGVRGARLGYEVPVFVSGVGLPDWTLISSAVLGSPTPEGIAKGDTGGDAGVLATGWFDSHWNLAKPLFEEPEPR